MATAMLELGTTAVGTRKLPYTEEQWKIPGYVNLCTLSLLCCTWESVLATAEDHLTGPTSAHLDHFAQKLVFVKH